MATRFRNKGGCSGWAIGSYLAVAIQLANLFPLAFMAYSAQRDGHSSTGSAVAGESARTGESQGLASYNAAIVTILSVGILSTTLTALFWKSTLWGSSMVFLTLVGGDTRPAIDCSERLFLSCSRCLSTAASIALRAFCIGHLLPSSRNLTSRRCLLGTHSAR